MFIAISTIKAENMGFKRLIRPQPCINTDKNCKQWPQNVRLFIVKKHENNYLHNNKYGM